MGFRTVVVLSNDQASTWENDPELGKKISHASNFAMGRMTQEDKRNAHMGYGAVVECAHADVQTLAVISNYNMNAVGHSHRQAQQTDEAMMLQLLRTAADKLGYNLTKKRESKSACTKRVIAAVNGV